MGGGHTDPTTMRTNRFIEEAAYRRENLQRTFRVTPRNAGLGFVFCLAIPVALYCAVKNQQVDYPLSMIVRYGTV